MDTYKLKMKIGEHEFDAEGPADAVQAQFEAWRSLVTATPTPVQTTSRGEQQQQGGNGESQREAGGELLLNKIMKQDGRVISLTARGASVEDEIMLVLLGQKNLRNNDSVTGGEIVDGLKLTGRTVRRVDYQLDKMTNVGDTITIGVGRARRYRLTNQGFAKAQSIATAIIQTVL